MMSKVGENVVWVSNNLDIGKQIQDSSCKHIELQLRVEVLGLNINYLNNLLYELQKCIVVANSILVTE